MSNSDSISTDPTRIAKWALGFSILASVATIVIGILTILDFNRDGEILRQEAETREIQIAQSTYSLEVNAHGDVIMTSSPNALVPTKVYLTVHFENSTTIDLDRLLGDPLFIDSPAYDVSDGKTTIVLEGVISEACGRQGNLDRCGRYPVDMVFVRYHFGETEFLTDPVSVRPLRLW
ncbi:MAG: hypothetical protein AAGB04_30860 [Pseudomonadota bacterium]